MRAREFIKEEVTQSELNNVEAFADRLWGKFGIDVNFTRHFFDRLNDPRNVKPISAAELVRLFKREYEKYGKTIAGADGEAVMKDSGTDINLPFAKHGDKMAAKTIMRKDDFKTPDPEYVVEEILDEILKYPVDYASDKTATNHFNNLYGSRIASGHTNVMYTPEMRKNETMVVRVLDDNGNIQYHIHTNGKSAGDKNQGKDVNKQVGIESMNIIYHDAKFYLLRGRPIKILAPTEARYNQYKAIAKKLLSEIPNKKLVIVDDSHEPDIDGTLQAAFKIYEPPKKKLPKSHVPLGDSPSHDDPLSEKIKGIDGKACWDGYRYAGTEDGKDKCVKVGEAGSAAQQAAIAVNMKKQGETPKNEDWSKVNKKDKTDGMSSKAVKAYRRENPGSKLKTAVTKDPKKIKKGSKDDSRRKSFCARSNGQRKMHNIDCSKTPDKPICKARRRWNCEE